jgi:prepilin-type N-terminal cleavage/methylation domain-containing protein
MQINSRKLKLTSRKGQAAMTLVEVLIAMAISGLAMSAIVGGYYFANVSAEKSSLLLAGTAKAMERLEEVRAAKWDVSAYPPIDQLAATNFPDKIVILDLSGYGGGVTYATNRVQISQISANPALKRIHVDCVWPFKGSRLITNSIETYRAPDQ